MPVVLLWHKKYLEAARGHVRSKSATGRSTTIGNRLKRLVRGPFGSTWHDRTGASRNDNIIALPSTSQLSQGDRGLPGSSVMQRPGIGLPNMEQIADAFRDHFILEAHMVRSCLQIARSLLGSCFESATGSRANSRQNDVLLAATTQA